MPLPCIFARIFRFFTYVFAHFFTPSASGGPNFPQKSRRSAVASCEGGRNSVCFSWCPSGSTSPRSYVPKSTPSAFIFGPFVRICAHIPCKSVKSVVICVHFFAFFQTFFKNKPRFSPKIHVNQPNPRSFFTFLRIFPAFF